MGGNVSLVNGHIDGCDTCVICGRDIPEGRQVCVICGYKAEQKKKPDLVEVRHGYWKDNHNGTFECSVCGGKSPKKKWCGDCGAKMDKGNKKQTNYDRIRNMSIEELARFRNNTSICNMCIFDYARDCAQTQQDRYMGVKQWLEAEVTE